MLCELLVYIVSVRHVLNYLLFITIYVVYNNIIHLSLYF